jgi:molybdate transport system ATP-binding protein
MLDVAISHRKGDFTLAADFSAEAGSITCLFGQSGAGKTTLVDLIAGLERPEKGRITLSGEVLFDSERGIDLPVEARRLGYVFQDGRLFPHMSVSGNLAYGMGRRGGGNGVQFDQVVKLLDIAPLLGRRPGTLSGGEKQRVAIGRALLSDPALLLMDEPLASLDSRRRGDILPFIERLRSEMGVTIVYVSHAIDEVIRLADTLVLLSDGRIAAAGGVEDLMSRLDLRPLTGRYEAGAVLAATVSAFDAAYGLAELAFAGGTLRVPGANLALGAQLRVHIRARDVSLSLTRPTDSSVLNVFAGTVTEIASESGAQVDVRLDVGAPLIARITRKSVDELGLKPGSPVHAMVKAVAIDRRSLGGAQAG